MATAALMSEIRATTSTGPGLDRPGMASRTPEHQPARTFAPDADRTVWSTRSGSPRAVPPFCTSTGGSARCPRRTHIRMIGAAVSACSRREECVRARKAIVPYPASAPHSWARAIVIARQWLCMKAAAAVAHSGRPGWSAAPAAGVTSPSSIRRVVVFPAPFGPRKPHPPPGVRIEGVAQPASFLCVLTAG